MTMRFPTDLGGEEEEGHPGSSERHMAESYVEVETAGADGSVTVIREWAEPVSLGGATRQPHPRQLVRVGTAITDWAAALIALVVSDTLGVSRGPAGVSAAMAVAALWPLALAASGRYRNPRADVSKLIAAIGFAGFAMALVGSARHTEDLAGRLLLAVAVLAAAEWTTSFAWSRYRQAVAGPLMLRTVIVGAADSGDEIAQLIRSSGSDMLPIARIDAESRDGAGGAGSLSSIRLDEVLQDSQARCVLVVAGGTTHDALDGVRRIARHHGAEVRVLVDTPTTRPADLHASSIGRHAVVTIPRSQLTGAAAVMKRAMDLVLGSVAVIVALPLMIPIGIAIKFTSPGPVFFRQLRITKGGRSFRILKFRTMSHAPEHPGKIADLTEPFFKLHDDPRLTKVGRLIRPLSLDELPQLWNVLMGDMSLVGPRPLPAEQVAAHPELLGPRHEVRAGMTGWWQVNGRSDLPAEDAVGYDLFYIDNWSLSFDIRILVRTVGVLLHRRGAY